MSVIRVDALATGSIVRVALATYLTRRTELPVALVRVEDNGKTAPIRPREWRRIVGAGHRRFVARVTDNDTVNKRLTVQIIDPHTSNRPTKIRYRVTLAYTQMRRLARLVFQDRSFASIEAENLFRRGHPQRPVQKMFFDPKDRFVPVTLNVP